MNANPKQQRLTGIDLFRGLAAFAVVLVHSGDRTWGLPVEASAMLFRSFFYFAVPFFLITSFFFMTKKNGIGSTRKFWQSRIFRVVIPYFAWTIIYISMRSLFFFITSGKERVILYLEDPLSLFFLGGASYHLYFLPMLMAGTILALTTDQIRQKFSMTSIALLIAGSIVINLLLALTGNAYKLGEDIALESFISSVGFDYKQPVIRLFSVNLAWLLRCLPYFLTTIYVHKQIAKNGTEWIFFKKTILASLSIFLLANLLGSNLVYRDLRAVTMACSLLILSIGLSPHIEYGKIISSLGKCAFGIYLIHPIAMNIVKPVSGNLGVEIFNSVSVLSVLSISILTFMLSWTSVMTLNRSKLISKYIFGS